MAGYDMMLKDMLRQHELQIFPLFGSCLELKEEKAEETLQASDLRLNVTSQYPKLTSKTPVVTYRSSDFFSQNPFGSCSVDVVTVKGEPSEARESSCCGKPPFAFAPLPSACSNRPSPAVQSAVVSLKAKRSFEKAVRQSLAHPRVAGAVPYGTHAMMEVESSAPRSFARTTLSTTMPHVVVPTTDCSASQTKNMTQKNRFQKSEESSSPIRKLSDYITMTIDQMSQSSRSGSMSSTDYFPLEENSTVPTANIGAIERHDAARKATLYDRIKSGVLDVGFFYWCHGCCMYCWGDTFDVNLHAHCRVRFSQHRNFFWPDYIILNCSLCGNMYNSLSVFSNHMIAHHR